MVCDSPRMPRVVSHESAAEAWGIELVTPAPQPTITVPRSYARVPVKGTRVYRRDLTTEEVAEHEGLRLTTPLRTVLDLGRSLPLGEAVAAGDSALRLDLVRLDVLHRTVQRLPPGRGSTRLRRAVALLDPAAGSVLESLLRVVFAEAGLPAPETQYRVCDRHGDFIARVDFCWPEVRLIVEADGFAFHSNRDAYRIDRERGNALELLGWRVLRFTWEDVVGRPEHVIATVRAVMAAAA